LAGNEWETVAVEKSMLMLETIYCYILQQNDKHDTIPNMANMRLANLDSDRAISAVDSRIRRKILQALRNDNLTLQEVFEKIGRAGENVKHRESVYRHLEKLVDAGLVGKLYDRNKGLCYKLLLRGIEIDFIDGTVKETERGGTA